MCLSAIEAAANHWLVLGTDCHGARGWGGGVTYLPLPSEGYSCIESNGLKSTYLRLEVAISKYLTIPVTNRTAERALSTLNPSKH